MPRWREARRTSTWCPLVCLDNRCPAIVGRVVTFHDDDHITITWARAVAREFGGRLGVP